MKMTFRWYGEKDSISLSHIRQIPLMTGVVTAVYDTPVGEKWSEDSVSRLKKLTSENGLEMEVIESVPVHEDIKLGRGDRDKYIENYKHNIRVLSKYGVKCICYNFMPVLDWVRTDLKTVNADGSNSLTYNHEQILKLDPKKLSLPGWDESYTPEQLGALIDTYKDVSKEKLFENLVYFLNQIIPVCEQCDVDMAIHPDDPPWDIFGIPRIISSEKDLDRLFDAVKSTRNGVTLCSGSFGAGKTNDLVRMAKKYSIQGRVHFVHMRNILHTGEYSFAEVAHCSECGSIDMFELAKALTEGGFKGYVRPDHGRNIWGESGKPGYGLYDRALGAAYLNGVFEAAEKIVGGKK